MDDDDEVEAYLAGIFLQDVAQHGEDDAVGPRLTDLEDWGWE